MLEFLTDRERDIVWKCLDAAAHGPFFDDAEFQTLLGVTRSDVAAIVDAWPAVDDSQETVRLAINNAMCNLIGYPHHLEDVLTADYGLTTDDIAKVLSRWRIAAR